MQEVPSLAEWDEDVAAQWHPTLNTGCPETTPCNSPERVWWKCEEGDDHVWEATVRQRVGLGAGCPYCGVLGAAPEQYRTVDNFYPRAKEVRDVFIHRCGTVH